MTEKISTKLYCETQLRHAEYYGLQPTFDSLYERSKNGEVFDDLMSLILQRENILLAYRNIKNNDGSNTPGTDGLTIKDIGRLTPDEVVDKVRYIVQGSQHGYRPKPVRRKEIPKPYDPTRTRPLGIPCIWDRLIQQCVKQVMEPVCEAKFSDNSYGFRPDRSTEHAIARCYQLMQHSHLHYAVEFDIKGFFDNVDHTKLIRQIWALGIHDKHLIYIIRQMLTAPVLLENGEIIIPTLGTPQGGIISTLFANIVLNELDQWIGSQWQTNPVVLRYTSTSPGYAAARKTGLKEMYIVRYADDFRIFCRTLTDARRIMASVTDWLQVRLRLEVSPEKTKITNLKRRYMDFLGLKMKVRPKGKKLVVISHIADKSLEHKKKALIQQARRIARPRRNRQEAGEVQLYNSMVQGIQNYYQKATHISQDCSDLQLAVNRVLKNRLKGHRGSKIVKTGRKLTKNEVQRYGKSAQLRYLSSSKEPIYPIGYVRFKFPRQKPKDTNRYTPSGRENIHSNLRINTRVMLSLMRQPLHSRSAEYADNRISKFCAQWGKCAVTGYEFESASEVYCLRIIPPSMGGTDAYENLVLLIEPVAWLIRATTPETIAKYKSLLRLNKDQLKKVDKYRTMAGRSPLS